MSDEEIADGEVLCEVVDSPAMSSGGFGGLGGARGMVEDNGVLCGEL
jgi:hypothetical protein